MPDPIDTTNIDDVIFNIEDYIGGNIEGVERIDRMGLTVFLRRELEALITLHIREAKLDELKRMNVRTMNDPDDDTNLFWYRTYTMPEFEARLKELQREDT